MAVDKAFQLIGLCSCGFSAIIWVLLRFCRYLFLVYLIEPSHVRLTLRLSYVPQPRHLAAHLFERERVEDCRQGRKNKQERQKLTKETHMCIVFANNGYKMEMLEEVPRVSNPDVNINSKFADLKSTKGAGNIVKYAHKAIKQQKAELILFEFEKEMKEVFTELEVLKSEKIDVLYYFKDTKVVYIL